MPNVREITAEEYLSEPVAPVQRDAAAKPGTRFSAPHLHLPGTSTGVLIQIIVGLFFIGFGAMNAGSAFTPASHMSGPLATIFYTWQGGTILIVGGAISVYDAIRKVL